MKPDTCSHGESVVQAARTGKWSDELMGHVAKCDSCRESSRVARWMMDLAETVESESVPLPDPHLVWLKAQIQRRSRDTERALLPIRVANVLSVLGLGTVLASLPREGWIAISESLARASTMVSELPSLQFPSSLTTLWIALAIPVVFLLLFAFSEA